MAMRPKHTAWRSRYPVTALMVACMLSILSNASAQIPDSTLITRFQLAESYMRAAQFQRAIVLLEDLYAVSPETHVFYDRLRTAYENVKRFDDAITLVDARINQESSPAIYLAEKARLQFLKGDEAEAEATWQAAIDTNPTSQSAYLIVYRSVMQVRLFGLAIMFLEQGRDQIGDETMFQTDLAFLYGLNSEHALAMREYLSMLRASDEQVSFVRARLNQFIEDEGALEASIAETEEAVARSPLVRSFREILGWLYVEAGRFREAYSVNRAIDQLEGEEGRVLFTFAQTAAEAGSFDVAIDAFEDILNRYPESPTTPDALRWLGIAQERWAEALDEKVYNESGTSNQNTGFHRARETYYRFLEAYPTHPYFPDVLRRIGHLQQDIFFEYESAEQMLSEVLTRYPQSRAADDAAFDMARLLLVNNDLVSAEVQFSRLVSRLRTGETADQARYELALIDFYRGEFDSALALAAALQENTSADVANDAISLKLLITENRGPDSLDTPLRQFSEALLLKRQRRTDEALSRLDLLLGQIGEHPLTDDLRFERAGMLRALGQPVEAVQAYLELPLVFPQSLYADQSLFLAAEILSTELGEMSQASTTYTRLLNDYPGSLLAPETRARIRTIRGDGT